MPRPGQVLGLVGTNGIGKSTALKVLAGKLKPNLGRFDVSVSSLLSRDGTDLGRRSLMHVHALPAWLGTVQHFCGTVHLRLRFLKPRLA